MDDQPLIRDMRTALRGEPFAFVALVSSILAALEAERPPAATAAPSLTEVVDSFLEIDIAETTAALHAIAAMTADELLAARIRRALPSRRQPIPAMVAQLGEARVTDAVLMTAELGDGDNLILGARWPDGFEVSPVVYVDHNLGTIVKDAFVVEQAFTDVVSAYDDLMAEQGQSPSHLAPIGLADARAKADDAIATGWDYEPEDEESQWPACRPFVQMLLRSMPGGGDASAGRWAYPDMTPDDAVAGFLVSPEATQIAGLPSAVVADAALLLAVHAAEHAGHPLRWSGVSVEIALRQVLPWDADVSDQVLDAVPDVLSALVLFSHRQLAVSDESTTEALESLNLWLDDYYHVRALPTVAALRRSNAELAAMLDGDSGPWLRRQLADELGSEQAVDALDDSPLPDEPLDLSAVPADVHDRVREVVALTDAFADEAGEVGTFAYADTVEGPVLAVAGDDEHGRLVATELRTACRRLVARAAANDPTIFRRRGRAETAAAAVVWVVGRANELVGPPPAPIGSGDAGAWFGVRGSSSQRAEPLLRAIGVDPVRRYGGMALGTPDLLTSMRRAALMRQRDGHA
ncbi:MAG: DUF6398 domain-containing protein [Jiangellales bacterium]